MKTWVITKLLTYLSGSEGFVVENNTDESVIIRDIFGFRYEVKVSVLGRFSYPKDSDAGEIHTLDFLEDETRGA